MRIRTGRVEAEAMEEREETHMCKICDRTFKCGRALGGHMRSHLTTLKLPIEPPKKQQYHYRVEEEKEEVVVKKEVDDEKRRRKEEAYGEEEEEEEEEDKVNIKEEIEENFIYSLRENPRKSFRLSDPEFSFTVDASSSAAAAAAPPPTVSPPAAPAIATTAVHDSQSDTEELYRTSRKRARTHRFALVAGGDASPEEPASSISETSPEEDVAISLMLLSRDLRPQMDSSIAASSSPASKRRRKFQCGTCRKIFPSYQALGGHRAGHKKSKGSCAPPGVDGLPELSGDAKVHECPVCFRVFGSGQALGGHKRTHLLGGGDGIPMNEKEDSMLDLNLPAAADDSTSAVSYAELIDPEKTN